MNEQHQPPMNGNDDLAKTLNEGLQFEETPAPGAPVATAPAPAPVNQTDDDMPMPTLDPTAGDPDNEPYAPPTMSQEPPVAPAAKEEKQDQTEPTVQHTHVKTKAKAHSSSELDGLKASALAELRPLVGKLKLSAEERFDTLLLIIRSTDDQSLLPEAHAAAKDIEDETRRAQALLDVIKEIDYFSSKR